MRPRSELIRLTVNSRTGEVMLNQKERGSGSIHGRSCYFCTRKQCCETALKQPKLRGILQGGRGLKGKPKRSINWPLEPRLIETLIGKCTENP